MINLSFKTKIIKKAPNRAIFEIEPLYPGYGVTIGNTIRRVLLSSIEGAAITQVKIKGAPSEFSTLPGIKEDILDIILNLKNVKLKLTGADSQKIELKVSGEKKVKAGDIKVPPEVEIINKDLHIASLTSKNAKLEIEMMVEKGLGYVQAEKLKDGKSEVGVIYLDAIFSPVEKVSFMVENAMFEKRTDYNNLKIEIITDGSIEPEEAFKKSLEIIKDHINSIQESFNFKEEKVKEKFKDDNEEGKKQSISLEDFNFSARTMNILNEAGIKSLEGLLRRKEESLREIKGMGEKSLKEIKTKLKKRGFELK